MENNNNNNKEELEDIQKQMIVSPDKDRFNDRVLSDANLKFFDENGYIVVKNVVPEEMCDKVVQGIWDFLGMSPSNPNEWYRPPATRIGMVEIYHHQAMWDTRQHPTVYKMFSELWNTGKLWVSIDRACMKTPSNPTYPHYDGKGFVHWDLDPWEEELPFGLQGVLVLEDTDETMGGFHCVPGMHKYLSKWIKSVKEGSSRKKFIQDHIPVRVPEKELSRMKVKKIPAKKGDFIIWRREIAHGSGHNVSGRPRLAQYINMFPARGNSTEKLSPQQCLHPEHRFQRIEMFENRVGPFHKPCDKRLFEKNSNAVHLTELGKKLLGSEMWDDE